MSTKKTSPKKRTTVKSSKTTKSKVVKGKKCASPNKALGCITLVILGVAAIVAISAIVIMATLSLDQKVNAQTDAERFASEYTSVSVDNPYVYKTAEEVIDIIEHGTGAVYLGFPSCPWCQAYAGYLADAAKDAGLSEIYYFNIQEDRANNTENYQKLVELLGGNLQYDDNGHRRIYVPDVVFVVDGRIIGNDLESSKDTAGESDSAAYWTEARVTALKNRLTEYAKQVAEKSGCKDTCNK